MLKKTEKFGPVKNFKEILEELGYKLISSGSSQYVTRAIYRGGNSPRSVLIDPEQGTFYDFPQQRLGSIAELIALTKNITVDEVNETLEYQEKKQISSFVKALDYPKVYNEESFLKLGTNYSYFEKRGISKTTQMVFEGRFVRKEMLAGRVCYPIRNFHNQIIGVTGRNIYWKEGDDFPKWKIVGAKRFFVYPHKIATSAIKKEGIAILVESCGDVFSLYEAGIHNVICTFGLSINSAITKYLIGLNPHVVISLNRDENKRGQEGAEKIRTKLLQYFGVNKVTVNLPPVMGDWNEILCGKDGKQTITKWYNSLKDSL